MDIFNSVITYITDFAATSDATYHVNPWIFGILFFGSALPLYYGYYRIAKSVVKFEKGKFIRININKAGLRTGILISCVAWLIPYIYVLLFGKLPFGILLIFIAFVIITGLLFIRTLMNKISKAEKQ